MFGSAVERRCLRLRASGVNVKAEFCGDDDLLTHGRESFADEFFILERSVNFRRIKKSNASFDGGPNQRDSVFRVNRLIESEAHSHTAETESRNFQTAVSEFSFLHNFS